MGPGLLCLLLIATPQSRQHERKGAELLLAGKVKEAQRELETCIRLDPNAVTCHRHLGVIFAKQDDVTRSIHHYKVYVTLDPYASDAHEVRRIIKQATGEQIPDPPARTLAADLKKAGQPPLDPKIKTLAQQIGTEGESAIAAGRLERARTLLFACIELNPWSAGCHRSLGVLFARLDEAKKAIEHYRRYVELAPDAPDAPRVRRMIADSERKH